MKQLTKPYLFVSTVLWRLGSLGLPRKNCCLLQRKRTLPFVTRILQESSIASSYVNMSSDVDKGTKRNVEVERKFLVLSSLYKEKSMKKYNIRQGYIFASKDKSVRVRTTDGAAYLTIKGETCGLTRKEFEYSIPQSDAEQLLDSLCLRPQIEKTRYIVEEKGFVWEVDEFHGENSGLVVAEVELEDESAQVELPDWVGKEVTQDTRFYNSVLFQNPFCSWPKEEQQKVLQTNLSQT